MEIREYTVEKILDPTGILLGDRYEFLLYLEIDEEDELYQENGVGLRVLFVSDDVGERIASYHFFERATDNVLDFAMEKDEEKEILEFCMRHKNDIENE